MSSLDMSVLEPLNVATYCVFISAYLCEPHLNCQPYLTSIIVGCTYCVLFFFLSLASIDSVSCLIDELTGGGVGGGG